MAYPIQPTITNNHFQILTYDAAGDVWDITANVTAIRGFVGSEADNYFTNNQPGNLEVDLYDSKTLLDAEKFVIGAGMQLVNKSGDIFDGDTIFTVTVTNIQSEYVRDPQTGLNVFVTTITGADAYADASNETVKDHSMFSGTAETQLLDDFLTELTADSTTFVFDNPNGTGTETINQFSTGGSVPDVVKRAAIGVDYYTTYTTGAVNLYPIPTAASLSPTWYLTDGTQASIPGGCTRVDYVAVDYTRDPLSVLSSVTLNNYGLDRNPESTTDKTVSDVLVPYTQTQDIGYTNAIEFDSAVATNNLGWNLLHEDGTGFEQPITWATTTNTTWKISRPKQSVMSLNGHYVYRCKAIAAAGAAIGSGFLLDIPDPEYDFVTTFPGGATSTNWIASVKIRVTTQRTLRLNINWYDANGNSTGTTTGTNTVINTGSWTTLSTQCSTANVPANSVTAVPVIVTNVAIGQYGYFFASEAMLTRTGVSTTFFNGDTDDTSSYCYTWTGTPHQSPSQKNVNSIGTYTAKILARRAQKYPIVQTVEINATQKLAYTDLFKTAIINLGSGDTFIPAYVCVNASTNSLSKYLICGMDFNITPTSVEAKLNVVNIPV